MATNLAGPALAEPAHPPRTQVQVPPPPLTPNGRIWRRFRRHKPALVGLVVLGTLIAACILFPIFTGYHGYTAPDPYHRFVNPSMEHLLGTDESGHDVVERLLVAGRLSLFIGFGATILAVTFGCLYGAIAGYNPGIIDTIMMRIVDFFLSLPDLPVLLVMSLILRIALQDWQLPPILGMSGQAEKQFIIFAFILSLLGWLSISRLVRASIFALRGQAFVEATRALGASGPRILFNHLLPNSLAPIIVAATLATGNFIILESTLSYLGLGVDPLTPTWGNMLYTVNQEFIWNRAYLAFYPGFMILITVLSVNFIGDALRDALDPRQQ